MTTITTPRLSLTRFVTDDWPFFCACARSAGDAFYGEVLSEEALRSVFVSRCADPGVFVLRDKFGEALGDVGSASARKIRTKLTSATRCCLRLREKAMPAKRCGRSASMVSPPRGCRPSMHGCWVKTVAHRACWRSRLCAHRVLEKAYHLNGVDYDDWIYRLGGKLIRRPQTPDEPIISANLSETAAGAGFSARQTAHPDALLLQFYPDAEK